MRYGQGVREATTDPAGATGPAAKRRDRRHLRHEATRQEILDVAWERVRTDGLAALSLRALARAVGIEPQSLYTYFPSKHAIYDAMFAQGNRELLRRLRAVDWPDEPRACLLVLGDLVLQFDNEDVARSQLLFDRVVPGFEPSPQSYALAMEAFELCRTRLARVGLGDPVAIDLFTALTAGLSAQQRANDPGGDRWLRLLEDAVDMYLAHVLGGRERQRTLDSG